MSSNAMIIDDLEPLVTKATSAPMLFLCGSGISIPFPAELPSAWDMINWTSSILKPEVATEKEREALKGEQEAIFDAPPEVFYQGLYDLVGPVGCSRRRPYPFKIGSPKPFHPLRVQRWATSL